MRRAVRRIHFVGVGGVGMSALAELLQGRGFEVSGSDRVESAGLERLRRCGVRVQVGHAPEHVSDADVVVYSSAVRARNPELVAAAARRVPVIPRAEMLAEVMRLGSGIAIAGTHGKTTTTSLVAHLLTAAGLDPTAVIGGRLLRHAQEGGASGGARAGSGEWIVAEADESDGSFLRLSPVIAVITNVEPEHLDHYGSTESLRSAFGEFASRVPFWGAVVACIDHPGVQAILPAVTRRVVPYGFSAQALWRAHDVGVVGGAMRFEVTRGGESIGKACLPLPGHHQVANALAALAVAEEAGADPHESVNALASFPGVERRFQELGHAAGVRVVDDYAHHPSELRATLAAARLVHPGRVVAVFQPHRYSRTRDLFDDFATAFNDADRVIVCEVYAAGEDKIPGFEGASLAEAIQTHGHSDVHFRADLEALAVALTQELEPGDLLLTLGAGNVWTLGERVLASLRAREGRA